MSGDASEFFRLGDDLAATGAKVVPALRTTMDVAGAAFAKDWSANARATSGAHGKHYPNSIDSEVAFDAGGVNVDVGPNSAKLQGSMGRGFEFGSENQPPHLDGLRALDVTEVRTEKLLEAVIGPLLP